MKVIIAGAGELGRLLAITLLAENHDVVVLDRASEELDRIGEKLDVMTVDGSCASISVLRKAGIETANALIAASGDEAANVLGCQLASRLGVSNTICRLYSSGMFSEADNVRPGDLGIWRTVVGPEECAEQICSILSNDILLEMIRFSRPQARMAVIEITKSSLLAGVSIKSIPASDILKSVRFAAILRGTQLIVPHGETILAPGDKIYIAGKEESIRDFLEWLNPNESGSRRLIISGADHTGVLLARKAVELGFNVRMIEPDRKKGEQILDELPDSVTLLEGDPTSEDMLDEAGISACDVFASTGVNDEDNILSCILAKRMGARKAVCLTHKPEYIRIVPTMAMIDCGLSATLVSLNAVLRHLEAGTMRVDAILQRFRANISEFQVSARSPLCGKKLQDCKLPSSLVLSLIFRGSDAIIPYGGTVLEPGDVAVAIVPEEGLREIEAVFPKR